MSRVSQAFAILDKAGPMPSKVRKGHPKPGPWRSEEYRRLVAALPCAACALAGAVWFVLVGSE